MPQNPREIFWLTTHVIENDLLKNSTWIQGWVALEAFVAECDQPQCVNCKVYFSVLEREQVLDMMMRKEALFTEKKYKHHPVLLVGDYYGHWAEEYRFPPPKQNGEPRTPAITSIAEKAQTLEQLVILLKDFAGKRATNLVKKIKIFTDQEMDTLLDTALEYDDVELEDSSDKEMLIEQFLQSSIKVNKRAIFAHLVKVNPKWLLKYPELLTQVSKTPVTQDTIANLEILIDNDRGEDLQGGQFIKAIAGLLGLGKDDINNWYRKDKFQKHMNTWRKKVINWLGSR